MKRFPLVLACLIGGATFFAQAQESGSDDVYVSPASEHRLRFDPGDPVLARLTAAGAVLRVEDFGSFVLAVVDENAAGGRSAVLGLGAEIRDDQAVVWITGMPLDTADRAGLAAKLDSIPPLLRAAAPDAATDSLWIVQFAGPIRDEWLARLRATGAAVVSPLASNAYVVLVGPAALPAFALLRFDPAIQWIGEYQPFFKLAPALRALDFSQAAAVDVTVQFIAGEGAARLQESLESARHPMHAPAERILDYVNVRISVPAAIIPALAADPAVFAIERKPVYRLWDEIQCQEVAGNLNALANGPSAPGYLAWLASKGFAQAGQFNFAVDVSDSGIDRGSLTDVNDEFRVLGPGGLSRFVYANNYTSDPLADCADGHGNLNASIAVGYNALTGAAYEDAALYNYGLGVCPFVQFGATKVFNNAGTPEFLQPHAVRIAAAWTAGARFNNNSWGWNGGNDYGIDSQAHDAFVRDATAATLGNQELSIIFAAGNLGGGANTISPPSTAKNIMAVGAAESNRQTGTDGCSVANAGANNVMDIINFSSRGPCIDGRKKPDIMAPGTHVQGALSRSLTYSAGGVCNFAWPVGQTLYTWASGTSFASPAVIGGAALVRQWFVNQGRPVPSPAMIKACLMTTTRYMTGLSANDTLWSNNQGMGLVDLGRALDAVARTYVDQTHVFGSTGQSFVVAGTVGTGATPFRVGLVWTDVPGPVTGNAWVNDLNLQVVVNGATYKGNVFTGASSSTGGVTDSKNNSEFVFIPAGVTGSFTVTVTAANIAGDGVPGNPDLTDQDFALFIYNGTACAPAIAAVSPTSITPPLAAPVQLTVTGTCFVSSSVVYANCFPLATTYVNATTLNCQLPPSIQQTQIPGAVVLNVQNAVDNVSNSIALPVGAGNNAGTIRRHPMTPAPGGFYSLVIEGGVPNAPFSLFGDLGVVTPFGLFPDPVTDLVLAVSPLTGSAGPFVTVIDGLGIFGTASGATLDATGRFVLPNIYFPGVPLGITATLQVAYLDPASPIGLRLTWARFPEQL